VRIVTWNLWWRFGPWEARRPAILTTLRELAPDVVTLQEVWADDGENLAGWLAGELGLHRAWAPFPDSGHYQRRIGDPSVQVGLAVLSRWPVLDRHVLHLPGDDARIAMHAHLDTPGHPAPVFTTHLAPQPHDSAVRQAQVAALAGFVAEHRRGTAHPAVVTGDLNAWPDSDEVRLLGGYKTAPAVPGEVLLDAWEFAEPGAPAATWDPANPYVAPGNPSARIDYVFVGPPGPDGLGRVRSVRRAADRPVGGVWPSDHLAVVADLA
jgi:endonuclease/exonuclease/phosphatase family metal-dependent hydrolase